MSKIGKYVTVSIYFVIHAIGSVENPAKKVT